VGYWLDRSLFPYARPDVFLELDGDPEVLDESFGPEGFSIQLAAQPDAVLLQVLGVAMLRRAIIVGAAMLAMGLGA
jgi:hypothetical protein